MLSMPFNLKREGKGGVGGDCLLSGRSSEAGLIQQTSQVALGSVGCRWCWCCQRTPQARRSRITFPWTSVSRMSRPPYGKVSLS